MLYPEWVQYSSKQHKLIDYAHDLNNPDQLILQQTGPSLQVLLCAHPVNTGALSRDLQRQIQQLQLGWIRNPSTKPQ